MQITVAPRFVAAPWEFSRERLGARTFIVRDHGLLPELGVLQAYQDRWPHRYAVWNTELQKWEIRQKNPLTGEDELYETLFLWDKQPEPDRPSTSDEVTQSVSDYLAGKTTQDGAGLVECYRPFDHLFVAERIKQSYEWQHLRGKDRLSAVLRDRNRKVSLAKFKQSQELWTDFIREDRRWLPALAELHAGKSPLEAKQARIAQSVGAPSVESPTLRKLGDVCRSSAAA